MEIGKARPFVLKAKDESKIQTINGVNVKDEIPQAIYIFFLICVYGLVAEIS